jgi:hypothetical protein
MSKKITQLKAATDVTANDLIQIVDVEDDGMALTGTNKKITFDLFSSNLANTISTGPVITAAKNRANHTGTQAATTITGLATVNGSSLTAGGNITISAVTADSVNAAIATNPAATRSSAGLGTAATTSAGDYATNATPINLKGLQNSVQAAGAVGLLPISVITIGDSFATFTGLSRGSKIVGSYRSGQATGGGDSGVTTILGDYAKSPDGRYTQISSGGNLTCAHMQSGVAGPATSVYYTLFPGTGTAQLQTSDNGGAWTNVGSAIDTSLISSVSIGAIALPAYYSKARCRVTATGGTVNGWIGQGLDGPGVTEINFATTGQGIEQCADVSETIWKAMITGYQGSLGSQIVYCAFADYRFTAVATTRFPAQGTPSWNSSGPASILFDWSRAANSSVDWMVVGPHQVNPSNTDAPNALLDAAFTAIGIGSNVNARIKDGAKAQREFAVVNSCGFVDCIDLFPDYAKATADGLYMDSIHLSPKGDDYKRAFVMENSNMGWLLGSEGYRSGIRLGDNMISGTTARAVTSALLVTSADGLSLRAVHASDLRVADPNRMESEGMGMWWQSSNLMQFGGFTPGGKIGMMELSNEGLTPITDFSNAIGRVGRRWQTAYFGSVHTGYVAKTANYTIASLSDHVIHCTSGTFDVTLPLSFTAQGNTYANAGRQIVITNTGAGTITVKTQDGGTGLQKINAATTLTVAAGETVRLLSTGTLAPNNYANWITI